MIAVQRIAAAAEIVVLAVRGQNIVNVVVDTLEGDEGTALAPLRGVVVDDIEEALNAVVIELLDQPFELRPLAVVLAAGGVAGIGAKKLMGL